MSRLWLSGNNSDPGRSQSRADDARQPNCSEHWPSIRLACCHGGEIWEVKTGANPRLSLHGTAPWAAPSLLKYQNLQPPRTVEQAPCNSGFSRLDSFIAPSGALHPRCLLAICVVSDKTKHVYYLRICWRCFHGSPDPRVLYLRNPAPPQRRALFVQSSERQAVKARQAIL